MRAEHEQFRRDQRIENQKFREEVEARFERIDERFERIDERFERMEARFGSIDQRLYEMQRSITVQTRWLLVFLLAESSVGLRSPVSGLAHALCPRV